tara:strand:+ start:8509 stop:8727 length:219 start_codon:yes stop_codon:yes gene_type:complete
MKKQIIDKLTTLITAAFGLVAALAWNDTIKTIFREVFGTQETIMPMLIYAVVVTIVAVLITIYVGKISERVK